MPQLPLSCSADEGDWFLRLAAWLLWLKRNAQGPWRLYVDLLPKVGAAHMHRSCSAASAVRLMQLPLAGWRSLPAYHSQLPRLPCRLSNCNATKRAFHLFNHQLQEEEMSCLMNYRPEELSEFQSPLIEARARVEREQIAALHERCAGVLGCWPGWTEGCYLLFGQQFQRSGIWGCRNMMPPPPCCMVPVPLSAGCLAAPAASCGRCSWQTGLRTRCGRPAWSTRAASARR